MYEGPEFARTGLSLEGWIFRAVTMGFMSWGEMKVGKVEKEEMSLDGVFVYGRLATRAERNAVAEKIMAERCIMGGFDVRGLEISCLVWGSIEILAIYFVVNGVRSVIFLSRNM